MVPLNSSTPRFQPEELTALRPLQRQFPSLDAATAEIARLEAETTLPKGVVHILSDIHGDDVKLRHVINNASGRMRPLVERMFANRLNPAEMQEFIALILYPQETLEMIEPRLRDPQVRASWFRRTLNHLFEIVRLLARTYPITRVKRVVIAEYRDLLEELLHEPSSAHPAAYYDTLIDAIVRHDRAFQVTRRVVRLVRNLAIDELVIGGDCWDRGHRGDRVVDYLMRQPNLAFVWGNHDTAWLGACLGHEPLIAHVLRISIRYRRLSALEEGYGITMQPLEHLVRAVYKDDPASCFIPKGEGLRDKLTMARMQKAAAVMQYKLEGQMLARNPEWGLEARRFLHTFDKAAGTITIEGKTYPLRDSNFPTFDSADPYRLSPDEQACMARIKQSFLSSQKLWEHMQYLHERGSMYLIRDDNLIFHGCVPVNEKGEYQELIVDGQPRKGKALFDAFDNVLARVMNHPNEKDRDWCWYLWCGPWSPLFGKDKIATFENDLLADKATHVETKNPYFQMVHEVPFCDRIMQEFGVDPARGLIVNGHVPVKIEQGELPLKRSGKAITIDGAFSQAYGDHGYTLVLEPDRTLLAKHHHFESVEAAVRDGVDIIPSIEVIRQFDRPRTVADTERGQEIKREVACLERLVLAYRLNQLRQG